MSEKKKTKKRIHWKPSRLIEDPMTNEVYVLMYGGSGRVRFLSTTEIQDPVWFEERFRRSNE